MQNVMTITHIHAHTTVLWPSSRVYLDEAEPEEILLDFIVQGKITEADTLTIRM